MKDSILVDIVMVAYNQEKYIGKAIESVIMQETDYSYKLIIGDDCSTDATYEICNEYALKYPEKVVLLKNSINLGLLKNYLRCFQECTGTYVAILEGDDYWTDPLKIQKQVELLDMNENIGLVHTNYKILNESTNEIYSLPPKVLKKTLQFQGYIFPNMIKQNFICSITVLFRRSILSQIDFIPFINNNCNTMDAIVWLQCALLYKVAIIQDQTAVYRVSPNSISNNTKFEKIEEFSKTKFFIKNYYLSKHKVNGYNITILKKSQNVFLLFKAIKAKNYDNIIKYATKVSITGLFYCIKEWKVYN